MVCFTGAEINNLTLITFATLNLDLITAGAPDHERSHEQLR